ncbi:MAG: hypothetical protein CL565_02810 [Alphaproteobacteria bacterium]|nr:hypothetical protein [Alphaproteobacteria bacterium]|tara:strand:+ start:342 stop:1025 length:684 start_codon:yes stop_codon:yes gene_type:complete
MHQNYTTELPDNYDRLVQVGSLVELFHAAETVGPEVNIIVYRRGALSGDFNALADLIDTQYFTDRYLKSLSSFEEKDFLTQLGNGRKFNRDAKEAALQLIEDIQVTYPHMVDDRREKYMACISAEGYRYKDTHLFHSDGAVWRLLACYTDPATEWIKNEYSKYVGNMGDTPIYDKADNALTYQFQPGDIWLQAGDYRNQNSTAFLHKAPEPELRHQRLMIVGNLAHS